MTTRPLREFVFGSDDGKKQREKRRKCKCKAVDTVSRLQFQTLHRHAPTAQADHQKWHRTPGTINTTASDSRCLSLKYTETACYTPARGSYIISSKNGSRCGTRERVAGSNLPTFIDANAQLAPSHAQNTSQPRESRIPYVASIQVHVHSSIPSLPGYDPKRRTSLPKHLVYIAYQIFRFLMSREMTSTIMLRFENDIADASCPPTSKTSSMMRQISR